MNFVSSNNLSLKYQRFTPSCCKDIQIRKFEFAAKTQFLWGKFVQKFRRFAWTNKQTNRDNYFIYIKNQFDYSWMYVSVCIGLQTIYADDDR